jgi:drug/metabolite transporter (DMT)-like permease
MHWLFWVFTSVFFGISYRLGYKLVSGNSSPLLNVAVITMTASLICFVLYYLKDYPKSSDTLINLKNLWPLLIVGVVMAGLEVSIMMIYRSGGPVSISQSLASSMVGIIIFAIGLIFFKEQLNTGQIIGFALGLAGITTLTYYSSK